MKYEWVGIIGSIMIIIAFTHKEEKKIRIFDAVGSVLFVVYGLLVHAWSTAFLNGVLLLVHLRRFVQMKRTKDTAF